MGGFIPSYCGASAMHVALNCGRDVTRERMHRPCRHHCSGGFSLSVIGMAPDQWKDIVRTSAASGVPYAWHFEHRPWSLTEGLSGPGTSPRSIQAGVSIPDGISVDVCRMTTHCGACEVC